MFRAQAVILAGGQGLRLRPYTTILPKPLLPVGEIPILEILIRQLKHYGFKNILIATGYLAELIEAYFGDGRRWGVCIRYVRESKPLGTAGALRLAAPTESDFLVLNGDVLTDMNFTHLFKWHKQQKAAASIAVKERKIQNDFGVIEAGADHELKAYHEKPQQTSLVSMGINVVNAKVRSFIKKDECIGIPDLMLRLKGASRRVCCYQVPCQWLDLGRQEDLEGAQDIFEHHKKKFIIT